MDFERYLRCCELPPDTQPLHHFSSCPAFGTAVFVSAPSRETPRGAALDICRSNSSHCVSLHACPNCSTTNKHKGQHVSVFELQIDHNCSKLTRSCLRQGQPKRGNAPRQPSVQNHWAWSHGYLGDNLAMVLGKALTLHTSPQIKRRKKKNVKFADQQGETLVTFSIVPKAETMEETNDNYWSFIEQTVYEQECEDLENSDVSSSDTPEEDFHYPWNSPPLSDEDTLSNTSSCSDIVPSLSPTCSICFEQPAANLEALHKKLERTCVGLENVKVDTKSNVVTCSIKVKNIHPEKRVFARCTSDGWRTHADLHAIYVDPGYDHSVYDSFYFALTRPLGSSERVRVEFAICYEVAGHVYWDNNDRRNYAIEWTGGEP